MKDSFRWDEGGFPVELRATGWRCRLCALSGSIDDHLALVRPPLQGGAPDSAIRWRFQHWSRELQPEGRRWATLTVAGRVVAAICGAGALANTAAEVDTLIWSRRCARSHRRAGDLHRCDEQRQHHPEYGPIVHWYFSRQDTPSQPL